MKKLKVYGGMPVHLEVYKQERCVVAAYNQREVAQIMGYSLYTIGVWWSITNNREEIEKALATPHTPIWMGRF